MSEPRSESVVAAYRCLVYSIGEGLADVIGVASQMRLDAKAAAAACGCSPACRSCTELLELVDDIVAQARTALIRS